MKTMPNEPINCNNGNGFWKDEFKRPFGGVGLTKFEYFAAMALQGLLASDVLSEATAKNAVKCAKLLIDELNKEQK